MLTFSAPVSAEEQVDSVNGESCDVTVDASCDNEDLHTENEFLRLDQVNGLTLGNGCQTLGEIENGLDLEMQDSDDPKPELENVSGCLVVIESPGKPFAFTCADGMLCTADRGPRNVTILGDGTRFEWAEVMSVYDVASYEDRCTYLRHELAYAELHDIEIVAFRGNDDAFARCDGVDDLDIDEETGVVNLDDVASGGDGTSDAEATDTADADTDLDVEALFAQLVPNEAERELVGDPIVNSDGSVTFEARDAAGQKANVTVVHPGPGFGIMLWPSYNADPTLQTGCENDGSGLITCPVQTTLPAAVDTWTVSVLESDAEAA